MSSYKFGVAVLVVFVLVIAGIAAYFIWPSGLGQASSHAMRRGFLQAIKVNGSLGALAPVSTGGGAGALYAKAYEKLMEIAPDADSLDNARHNIAPEKDPGLMAIVTLLEKAAAKSIGRRYMVFSPKLPVPAVDDPIADRVAALGDICSTAGAGLMADGRPKAAVKALQASMVFGYRVWKRGLLVDIRGNALGAMDVGVEGLAQLYKSGPLANAAKFAACEKLHRAISRATKKWFAKSGFVCVIAPRPGDMVYIARHDQDISWRIEAIMELGVARWATDYQPRAAAIKNFLHRLAGSRNPWIRRAAARSIGLTLHDIQAAG